MNGKSGEDERRALEALFESFAAVDDDKEATLEQCAAESYLKRMTETLTSENRTYLVPGVCYYLL